MRMTYLKTPNILADSNINPHIQTTYFTFRKHYPIIHWVSAIAIIVLFLLKYYILAFVLLLLHAFLELFYRLPIYEKLDYQYFNDDRMIHTIKSPSFGKILKIEEYANYYRISTFLDVTDVHYQYFPINGRVIYRKYQRGSFHPAYLLEKTKYNERCHTLIEDDANNEIEVIQIAGLLARRIDTFYTKGREYQQGDLLGIIHFGSRVDTIIPKKINSSNSHLEHPVKIMVREGQRVIGGQTILAVSNNF